MIGNYEDTVPSTEGNRREIKIDRYQTGFHVGTCGFAFHVVTFDFSLVLLNAPQLHPDRIFVPTFQTQEIKWVDESKFEAYFGQ